MQLNISRHALSFASAALLNLKLTNSSTPLASDDVGEESGQSPPHANMLLPGEEQKCCLSVRRRRYFLFRMTESLSFAVKVLQKLTFPASFFLPVIMLLHICVHSYHPLCIS